MFFIVRNYYLQLAASVKFYESNLKAYKRVVNV